MMGFNSEEPDVCFII